MGRQRSEEKYRHGRVFRYVPLVLVVIIIFLASTAQASMTETSYFIGPLLRFFFPNSPESTLLLYHSYLRKFAHIVEYAALGFFASRAFWTSRKSVLRENWHLIAMAIVLIVASVDEFNQSLNPTRTGSVYDVMLDFFSGALMIGSLVMWKKIQK